MRSLSGTCALAVVGLSACLAETYEIPGAELARLAGEAPARRGLSVRVVQRFEMAPEPPPAHGFVPYTADDGEPPPAGPPETVSAAPGGIFAAALAQTTYRELPRLLGIEPPVLNLALPATKVVATGHSGGASVSLREMGNIESAEDLAGVVIALAAAATIALVLTEGTRYDGWITVDPNHPLHLLAPSGQVVTLPLAALEPEDVAPGTVAVLREGEGRGMFFEGRAPLYRAGFAWRFEPGFAQVPLADGALVSAGGVQMQLGYFPVHELGLLLTCNLVSGSHLRGDVLGARYGLEMQAFPLAAEWFHAGLFAWGGGGSTLAGGGQLRPEERNDWAFGGGLLLEFDLTTRLALSLRAGVAGERVAQSLVFGGFQAAIGVAVY